MADFNTTNKQKQTVLMRLLGKGLLEEAGELLKAGADAGLKDEFGENAVFYLLKSAGDFERGFFILKGSGVDVGCVNARGVGL